MLTLLFAVGAAPVFAQQGGKESLRETGKAFASVARADVQVVVDQEVKLSRELTLHVEGVPPEGRGQGVASAWGRGQRGLGEEPVPERA